MPSSRRTRKKRSMPTPSSRSMAGAPIAAGGFGCVFSPPIACADKSLAAKQKANMVSKLMGTGDALAEKVEMDRIAPVLAKIPNAEKYFLLSGAFLCAPGKLNDGDLKNFDSVCRNIPYRASSINNHLSGFRVLNMPNGGPSMKKYFESIVSKGEVDGAKFVEVNNALIELLEKAIVPMNKLGLIHMDLKADNVLCDSSSGKPKVRIIDWGLAHVGNDKPSAYDLSDWVSGRPIQFNLPVTVRLFSTTYQNLIKKYAVEFFATGGKASQDAESIGLPPYALPAANQIAAKVSKETSGHVLYLVNGAVPNIFRCATLNSHNEATETFRRVLTGSYAAAIGKFSGPDGGKKKGFDATRFYTDVFRKNADIWGFVMVYYDLLKSLISSRVRSQCDDRYPLTAGLQRLLTAYCMSSTYAAEPIPVDTLVKDLKALNDLVTIKKRVIKKAARAVHKSAGVRRFSPLGARKKCPAGTRKRGVPVWKEYSDRPPQLIDVKEFCVPKEITYAEWEAIVRRNKDHSVKAKSVKAKSVKAKSVKAKTQKKPKSAKKSLPRSYTLKKKRCRAGYRKVNGRCRRKA